jgi:hypothetical protein
MQRIARTPLPSGFRTWDGSGTGQFIFRDDSGNDQKLSAFSRRSRRRLANTERHFLRPIPCSLLTKQMISLLMDRDIGVPRNEEFIRGFFSRMFPPNPLSWHDSVWPILAKRIRTWLPIEGSEELLEKPKVEFQQAQRGDYSESIQELLQLANKRHQDLKKKIHDQPGNKNWSRDFKKRVLGGAARLPEIEDLWI